MESVSEIARYRAVKKKGRILIIDEKSSLSNPYVTPNLEKNELKIKQLNAKDCPISALCITIKSIKGNVLSSFCEHMGFYPDDLRYGHKKIRCRHGSPKDVFLDARPLKVDGCPLGDTTNCIDCEKLYRVRAEKGPIINKSHAHVICKEMRKGG